MHRAIPGRTLLKHSAAHSVAVVALGNPLRGDDALASHLLAGLPPAQREALCILDAGSYTRDLPEFLHQHQVGIVVDAAASKETIILDLCDVAQRHRIMLDCCHAISWLDEIVLYQDTFDIPKRLWFVGLPTYEAGWREGLSKEAQEKLPLLIKLLSELIKRERTNNA